MKCKSVTKLSVSIVILLIVGTSITPVAGAILNNKTLLSERQVGFNDDFDQKILSLMKQAHMPSLSTGIIKNNSMVWYRGYGHYNVLTRKRPSPDTIYMIGSISKSITATALMQLYEQGNFDLDDDVSDYLPFTLRNPKYLDTHITFRMLLAHQSSLFDHDIGKIMNALGLSRILRSFITSLFIPNILREPYPFLKELLVPGGSIYTPELWMDYPPGAEANYSNLGYVILGYLVERIANQSIEQYCYDNIFTPLQMKDTRFHPYDLDRRRMAVPYYKRLGRRYIRLPHYDFLFAAPAGGVRTTVEDLSHFLIAHMDGGMYNDVCLLNKSTIDLMHTLQYPNSSYSIGNNSPGLRFGLGWYFVTDKNNETYGGHQGGTFGGTAWMMVRLSDNNGIIYFFNRTELDNSEKEAFISIIQALKEKLDEV